ncbi:MAG: type VI secretion system-associated FHA domain protein TagH [Acetobacteraceae bacterium]|nr:type VI secretion system-associated FHA domain protein TagH [Acetobacteraceae bacterium]
MSAATAPVAASHAAAAEPGDFDPFAEEAPLTATPQANPPAVAPANATPAPHPAAAQAPGGALPAEAAVTTPVAAPSPGPVGATPVQPTPAVAAASAPVTAATGASGASGLAAFLAGAGLAPGALSAQVADPDAALRGLGAAFRAVISGLRALLIARADVKREFRIEQTLLRAAGNNPVKFAATDDAAVLALAAQGAKGIAAVEETISDLTAHQVATLAATQAAARALLERLAPAGLEAEVKGGGSLFGASREKLLWEAYKKLHQQVVEQFDDDFDSAFGKAFARAYEQAARRGDGGGAG